MNEATCKAATIQRCKTLMPGCVILRHEDLFRSGVPDMSVTWHGRTSWWEAKVAWEGREPTGKKQQKITCFRLAEHGICFYVIFTVSKGQNSGIIRTEIVHPSNVLHGAWPYRPVTGWTGLAYREVAEFMRSKHP